MPEMIAQWSQIRSYDRPHSKTISENSVIVLGEGNLWYRFCLFIQFLPLWSMDEKAEAEPKIALAKHCHSTVKAKYS